MYNDIPKVTTVSKNNDSASNRDSISNTSTVFRVPISSGSVLSKHVKKSMINLKVSKGRAGLWYYKDGDRWESFDFMESY